MSDDVKRRFILMVLNRMMKHFNMYITPIDKDIENLRLNYDFAIDMHVEYTITFKELLKFFNVDSLYYMYTTLSNRYIYKELVKSKYFNENIFDQLDSFIEAIGNKEIKRMMEEFIQFIFETHDFDKNHYIYTKYSQIHAKAIDYYFKTDFEEDANSLLKEKYDRLLSLNEARKQLSKIDKLVDDETVQETIDVIKLHSEDLGGLVNYLSIYTDEEISADLAETFRWYTTTIKR